MKLLQPVPDKIALLHSLPSLPQVTLRLIKACQEETSGVREITDILEKDPAMTSRILRLVNSAYYALPRRVVGVDQAVGLLGINAIKNVAICVSLQGAFPSRRDQPGFDLGAFWWHSLRCALLSREIAKAVSYSAPDEAFLAGLLHDIGRLAIWTNARDDHPQLLERSPNATDFVAAYETLAGFTHAALGAWLLDRWSLPSFIVDAVLYHHEDPASIQTALPLVQVVFAANLLSRDVRCPADPLHVADQVLGLGEPQLSGFLAQTDAELNAVASSLDLEIAPPSESESGTPAPLSAQREQLVERARSTSLLAGTLQMLVSAVTEEDLLLGLQQGFHILFEAGRILFFTFDPEKNGLRGRPIPGVPELAALGDVFIPLCFEESALVRCLKSARVTDTPPAPNGSPHAILDQQLAHCLGKEGLACWPLLARRQPVGVAVVGLDPGERETLRPDHPMLRLFLDQAALALEAHLLRQQRWQMVQDERFLAASTAAGRVVHEVNNPLSIIKNYLRILAVKLADHGMCPDEIQILNEEIDRVVTLLRSLATLSQGQVKHLEPVNINALIQHLVRITSEAFAHQAQVQVHLDLAPALPDVAGNRDALKQVLLNLMNNAVEAMGHGGNLRLSTRSLSPSVASARPQEQNPPPGFVEISIADDGPGIPESIRSQVFDPFFTSKGPPHSGLGLSVVQRLVRSMAGSIRCESEPGHGTTFRLTLPTSGATP